MEDKLPLIVAVVILGVSAQWFAWRLNLPSILLLLVFGILAGPVLGILYPDRLFGEDLLFPMVSLSVALILYEGGLSLRFEELQRVKGVVRNLVTVAPAITGCAATIAAWLLFDLSLLTSALIGALFIVTGPTVIGPLLLHVRPAGSVGPILKWEGIVTDPLGAMVAVLLFEVLLERAHGDALSVVWGVLRTLGVGGAFGAGGAALLYQLLKRHLVPDLLQNPFSLMLVLMVFVSSNMVQPEAGLVGVTLMGILLANQRSAPIRHIIEFKENLRVLLLSAIFIVLAARLEPAHLQTFTWRHYAFLVVLIVVIRPLSIFLATIRTSLTLNEKIFLSCLAPRGIVAAAVASVLGHRLVAAGRTEAEILVPLTFLVIIGTVTFYSLIAGPAARWLGLSEPKRQGVLILGAHPWARALAQALAKESCPLLMVDSNANNARAARMSGIPCYHGNLLADYALEEIDLSGLGHLLALTPNDEVNTLACLHMEEVFGRSAVFQLATDTGTGEERGGRRVFGPGVTFGNLYDLHDRGATIKLTPLSQEFDLQSYRAHYGEQATPLMVIGGTGGVRFATETGPLRAQPGDKVLSMVLPEEQTEVPSAPPEVVTEGA